MFKSPFNKNEISSQQGISDFLDSKDSDSQKQNEGKSPEIKMPILDDDFDSSKDLSHVTKTKTKHKNGHIRDNLARLEFENPVRSAEKDSSLNDYFSEESSEQNNNELRSG